MCLVMLLVGILLKLFWIDCWLIFSIRLVMVDGVVFGVVVVLLVLLVMVWLLWVFVGCFGLVMV